MARESRFLASLGMTLFRTTLAGALVLGGGAGAAVAGGPTKHANKTSHGVLVQTGLDMLEAQKFAALRGKSVGLITNHTGQDAQGRSTVDVLFKAPGVKLVALFSPEHGLAGRNDEKINSSTDAATG
ncbi:MAG: exo-beta-N-acetylmuramidase NamZ domain-containing protein, partial [Candidatus Acidiferrum sp.]